MCNGTIVEGFEKDFESFLYSSSKSPGASLTDPLAVRRAKMEKEMSCLSPGKLADVTLFLISFIGDFGQVGP